MVESKVAGQWHVNKSVVNVNISSVSYFPTNMFSAEHVIKAI